MQHDLQKLMAAAKAHGQEHLFAFYAELSAESKAKLLDQIASLDFDLIDRLVAEFVKGGAAPTTGTLEPAPVIALPKAPAEKQAEAQARATGDELFRKNRVACFLVAGGQGTRLGLHGPKGAFVIGPISHRTLFQLHAEKIIALRRRYNATVPWLIMTSDANDAETREFFVQHNWFGMGEASVRIFKQGNMPAVSRDGKILMQAKDEIALSPNGHGGSIKALYDSGSVAWLKSMGIDTLFYFQVDNVLTKIGDPTFLGYHAQATSQMSSKACRKRDWKEKVGVFGLKDGRLAVIEYSDLPENIAKETDANGNLKWWAGSIAIHVLDIGFIEKLNHGGFQLPYHKAEKAVPCIAADGQPAKLKPGEKNGIKFETFVFDALSQADRTVTVETAREEDFSPVKNADGEDSPATSKRDLMELYARWLTTAGTRVPRKADGSLDCRIEIRPLTSLQGENLKGRAPAVIRAGEDVLM
ncbi:MAG TPA: UDPGP type 1 family protein [Planctomycetota bacterium]|jgi:UDP-N-acetylglucosamine/UDP-N-acetylgalactosamine diphosphorylase